VYKSINKAVKRSCNTLSNVTKAVPATDEYAVLIGFVDTPGPRSMSMTVKPV
jgi:hypothetical protein